MAAASVISAGTIVHGNVESDGSVEVLGRVEGAVTADGEVIVGAGGSVGGSIVGGTVRVAGEVGGDLRASEGVYIESTGRVIGDSVAPRIGIADGALIRGHVRTEGVSAKKPAPVEPARPRVPPLLEAAHASDLRRPPPPELPILGRARRALRRRRKELAG